MPRIIILVWIAICATMGAVAQSSLHVGELFDGKFSHNKHATEVRLTGKAVSDYDLDAYASLCLTDLPNQANEIERLLAKDAEKAIESEVINKGGRLYYAFYRMPDLAGSHRYLLYLNQHATGGNKIILAYMKGSASTKQVKQLLKINSK